MAFAMPAMIAGSPASADLERAVGVRPVQQNEAAILRREAVASRFENVPGPFTDKAQMPDEEKRAKAHFVVETDKGLDHAFEQVKAIVTALRAKRNA